MYVDNGERHSEWNSSGRYLIALVDRKVKNKGFERHTHYEVYILQDGHCGQAD